MPRWSGREPCMATCLPEEIDVMDLTWIMFGVVALVLSLAFLVSVFAGK